MSSLKDNFCVLHHFQEATEAFYRVDFCPALAGETPPTAMTLLRSAPCTVADLLARRSLPPQPRASSQRLKTGQLGEVGRA